MAASESDKKSVETSDVPHPPGFHPRKLFAFASRVVFRDFRPYHQRVRR